MPPHYVVSASGFVVGVIVGLTGVGGGALMTPLLLLVFGVPVQTAVGTDLLYAALTKSAGTIAHGFAKSVDWLVVRRLSCGSIPAAAITVWFLRSGSIERVADQLIVNALGGALIMTGIAQLFRPLLHKVGQRLRTGRPEHFRSAQPLLTVVAGVLIGALVTLTSIGAGALGAAVLTYLYPYRLTPVRLVATDIAHAIPLALVAGAGHLSIGNVDFSLLGWLLLGSVPGIVVGARLAAHSPDTLLRGLLAVVLTFVGGRMLV